MSSPRQGDLFANDPPTGVRADEMPPPYRPNLDDVRAKLRDILAKTRAAEKLPQDTLLVYRTIFPHMTNWLPEDEGAQLRIALKIELERLEKAA